MAAAHGIVAQRRAKSGSDTTPVATPGICGAGTRPMLWLPTWGSARLDSCAGNPQGTIIHWMRPSTTGRQSWAGRGLASSPA